MFACNLVVTCTLLVAATVVLAIVLNVWIWPFMPLVVALSKVSIFASPLMAIGAAWIVWFITAPWFKTVIILSLSPSIIVGVLLAWGFLGFPFRKTLQSIMVGFLEKGLEHDKGIFSYFGTTFLLFGTAIGGIVLFLNWLYSH